MPPSCAAIIKTLNRHGYEAYLVGGCVRDMVLGFAPNDWDICTDALPEEMQALFPAHRVLPTGLKHGTVTILQDGDAIEVTTYRHDGVYEDHRRPKEVTFTKSLAEDLARRDFTINALAWHPATGLVDHYQGLEDLKHRTIRAVGNPWTRFEEDGLRILRMVRFATRLAFEVDPDTLQAAKDKSHLLTYISKERIKEELDKILLTEHVARGLMDMVDLGLFPYVIPEKCHEVGFSQNHDSQFLDVFDHAALTTGIVPARLPLRLAAMAHDIGKPFTWILNDRGQDRFPDHALVGSQIANDFLRDLRYDNKTRKHVVTLIKAHQVSITHDPTHLRQLLRAYGPDVLTDLIDLRIADILAHRMTYPSRQKAVAYFHKVRDALAQVLQGPPSWHVTHLALSGHDLIELGYRGPAIKAALEGLLDLVVEDPSRNTRAQLLARLPHASS